MSTFQSYWKVHYPKLAIPNARQDICNDCFVLSHSFRYHASCRASENNEDDDNNINDDVHKSQEKAVQLATLHVMRAATQRAHWKELEAAAKSNPNMIALVMDFMQNVFLPHFGNEQTGKTHCFSPLNLFVFGVHC